MNQEPDYHAEMKLPEGKTCADCRNSERCDMLFGAARNRFTSCDFWPSRYRELAGKPLTPLSDNHGGSKMDRFEKIESRQRELFNRLARVEEALEVLAESEAAPDTARRIFEIIHASLDAP